MGRRPRRATLGSSSVYVLALGAPSSTSEQWHPLLGSPHVELGALATVMAKTSIGAVRAHCGTWRWRLWL
ncbi:MAG: hypothetical protein ACRDS1_06790 [Pseudonocardiaceae bacterium]